MNSCARARKAVVAATLALLASCGGGNPGGPSLPPPVILCPAPVSVQSAAGGAVAVTYPAPAVSDGQAPVTTSCTPPSGSAFAVGSTSVVCTARDASQRSASCSFPVTVSRTPQLAATRFLAFGDSITSGKLATDCGASGVMCSIQTILQGPGGRPGDPGGFSPFFGEESSAAYPRALQALLAGRYSIQTFVMVNEGNAGELVADGRSRLGPSLFTNAPEVLLLQEGANDMSQFQPPVEAIVENFRAMVRDARVRGVRVFLGTILPERQNACRARDFCDGVDHTILTNARLRTMAAAEGAILVDLYAGFAGQEGTLLGLDGLHPNEAGYQKMAEIFYEAIKGTLESR